MRDGFLSFVDSLRVWQEKLVGALVAATVALILLNVVTRSVQFALFWVDELAVYCMIWAFMFGAATTAAQNCTALLISVIVLLTANREQDIGTVPGAAV